MLCAAQLLLMNTIPFMEFEFATYVYNEIMCGMESNNIKLVHHTFAACKKDPNPSSVIAVNFYNQLGKITENTKNSRR